MKPCSKNRKLIALLAADALPAAGTEPLRSHLQTCDGCRAYYEEISQVTYRLATTVRPPEMQTSIFFHRRVLQGLRAAEAPSVWEKLIALVRSALLDWRLAVPLAAVAVIAVAVWLTYSPPAAVIKPNRTTAQIVPPPAPKSDPPPTISAYQSAARRSPEALDQMLMREAQRGLPSAPIYNAFTVLPGDATN